MKSLIHILLLTLLTQIVFAQDTPHEISGKIIDSTTNEPLVAVIVAVKGSTNSVITDENGAFTIKTYRAFPITLQVSYIGYKPLEYELSSAQSNITLALKPQTEETDEVLVTSRRREEVVQDIPIPISVISGKRAEEAGLFNVNRAGHHRGRGADRDRPQGPARDVSHPWPVHRQAALDGARFPARDGFCGG